MASKLENRSEVHSPGLIRAAGLRTSQSVVIETSYGKLRGLRANDAVSFKGISYAADTSNKNRFQAPRPPLAWTGIRDAFDAGNRCPQLDVTYTAPFDWYDKAGKSGEDCCSLNIFSPDADKCASHPVMVFIHGGGFYGGGSNAPMLDGSNLARDGNVVVVTLNHRLNIFGYTNFGSYDGGRFKDAANAGQLDIIAALRWIKENISEFGGDPDCVTLFGQSGGGAKIMALMAMPEAKGLFHGAINMSGGTMWGEDDASSSDAAVGQLLRTLQISPDDLSRLCDVSVGDLLRARAIVRAATGYEWARPVVDNFHIPAALFTPGGLEVHAAVPLLLGATNTEATFYFRRDPRNFAVTEAQLLDRISRQFELDLGEAKSIIAAYREDEPASTAADILIQIASDVRFRGMLIKGAEKKASAGGAPVYHYHFLWNAPVDNGIWRAPHGIDIPFAFGNYNQAASLLGAETELPKVTENLMGAFLAFARTGNPSNTNALNWEPYNAIQRTTMTIGASCKLQNDFHKHGREASLKLLGAEGPALDHGPLYNYSH